jgi:hypothetical protein
METDTQMQRTLNDGPGQGTTVITIGLTPPMIGGGLALAYLGVKRLRGASGQPGPSKQPAPTDRAGEAAGRLGSGAGQVLGSAAGAAGESIQTMTGSAGRVIDTAATAARSGTAAIGASAGAAVSTAAVGIRQVPRIAQQSPALTLGVGLGLGAIAALLIPPSRTEEQLVRPARETVAQKVGTAAQDTVEKVQLVADEAATTIKQSAKEVGLVPAGSSNS